MESTHFTKIMLPTFSDSRGTLTVMESSLPFSVVRTYWIYGADDQARGGHRHAHTRQALIAVHGKVSVFMDDGIFTETIDLLHPGECLLVEPKDWHTMKFDDNAVLLVMSSHTYDRSDYIDTPYQKA